VSINASSLVTFHLHPARSEQRTIHRMRHFRRDPARDESDDCQ
jgi:hypothetical protein